MEARLRQSGLTLVEVLVGMAVGIIVTGGAVAIYVSSVRSGNEALLASKLNQELGALMHVMTNDIRRAGFWGTALGAQADENPFNMPGATALVVRNDMSGDALQSGGHTDRPVPCRVSRTRYECFCRQSDRYGVLVSPCVIRIHL